MCAAKLGLQRNPLLPPHVVARKAEESGWTVDASRFKTAYCSACVGKAAKARVSLEDQVADAARRAEARLPPQAPTPAPEIATMPSTPPTTAPTSAASKGTKRVWALLLDHYDDDAKRYEPGHSDASIAKASGMALDVVARIREEHFGPDVDPRIAELERELAVAREQVEHDRTELEAMVAESARAAIVRLEAIAAKLAAVTKTKA